MSIVVIHPLVRSLSARSIAVLDLVAPARAAARAEQPEEASAERKCHGQPDDHIHLSSQRAADIVFLKCFVESSKQNRVEDGSSQGESEQEEAADDGDDSRDQTPDTAEEGEDSDEDFNDGGNNSDDVGDEHPFGGNAVRVQAITELLAEQLVDI